MFERYIYQPFFNILVGLYEVLGRISPELADMGIAVVIFSVIVQLLLFPLRLAGERSEEEKKKIIARIEEAKRVYSHEPIRQREEIKSIMRSNAKEVIATSANLLIGIGIILMLYRIFTTGLEGADFYLLYDFMPQPDHINLLFLGKYDLSHTNTTLNLVQSLMIFVV
jgi:membrane protein insertase Oxa1/YidC/SpoIIIJ